jgi:hypothetical protein
LLLLNLLAGCLVICSGATASGTGRLVESEFTASPTLSNRHLQTIWPRLTHREGSQEFSRQRVELGDGDYLDLDWFPGNPVSPNLVVLLHGLGGSSASHYIKRTGNELLAQGFRVVVMNLRGATGPNLKPRTYHSGETGDLQFVLDYLLEHEAFENLFVVGFSLGGNIVLKWLGENPGQRLVAKTVAVSPPFELSISSRALDSGLARIYRNAILRGLRRYLRSMQDLVSPVIDYPAALAAETLRQYDELVTAPLNGFRDADDYYRKSSCRQFLPFIDTPALIIHARDDPFATTSVIPTTAELGSGVVLELSEQGGHVGFVGPISRTTGRYWLPARITRYLSLP